MLASGKERETAGAIAVLEGNSGLQDQRLAKKFNQESAPDAVAEYFLSLYPNRVQGILCPRGCRSWTTISKHWRMPDETVLAAIAVCEPSIYGLRWGEQTRFAVLDVDKNSKYHSLLELEQLQERLAAVGLAGKVYRSSESGGWHLYLFFDDWAGSAEVNETLGRWLRASGYEIRAGTLEVFPSGMGLRLPLQAGFAWLDEKGELIKAREELTRDEALASFLCDLEENKRNWSEAKDRIRRQLEARDRHQGTDAQEREKRLGVEGFDGLFNYRLIPEKYEKGREYWGAGLTEKGQRHDAILCVEHYLWHGDPAAGVRAMPAEQYDDARYRLILAWLEAKHNGFCNHINRGQWRKVEQQIRRACKWRRPFGAAQVRTPYLITERAIERLVALYKSTGRVWSMEDFEKGNDGRLAQARRKILEATEKLIAQGRRVTLRQLMRSTGCHRETLKKHIDIWGICSLSITRVAGDKNPFLDLIGPQSVGTALNGSKYLEEGFLTVRPVADSGDLDCLPVQARPAVRLEPVVQTCASDERAPLDKTPPLLLPGGEPSSEPPASRPSPPGAVALLGSLDAGALVRRDSGRGADDAGGSEPGQSMSQVWARSGYVFVISQTYRNLEKQTGRLDRERIGDQVGQVSCTGAHPPASQICLVVPLFSGAGSVCYTGRGTVSGIKEVPSAASRVSAQSSFWAKRGREKRIPDAINFKLLATVKPGSESGFSDEFSLIWSCGESGERLITEPSCEWLQRAEPVAFLELSLLTSCWAKVLRFAGSGSGAVWRVWSGVLAGTCELLPVRGRSRARGPPKR